MTLVSVPIKYSVMMIACVLLIGLLGEFLIEILMKMLMQKFKF